MKNILVLGGTGFVGAHVCEKLVAQGWQITVATRRRRNARHVLHLPSTTVLEMDVHNDAALAQVLHGMDAVVNLVAILHGTQEAFDRVHVALPQKLARASVTAGVQHLVHISALGADARTPEAAPSMYLRSKGYGEAALRRAAALTDLRVTVLRPSVIFGAEDHFLNVFAKLQKLAPFMPLAGAHARFQPVWVEDVASAVVRCLECGMGSSLHGKLESVFEACGPDIYTLKELVQLAGQLSGANEGQGRPVMALPNWLGRIQAALMECLPGEPLMSRDNLDSMRIDNVATGLLPGLVALGITPAALKPIAQDYLTALQPNHALLGIRQRVY